MKITVLHENLSYALSHISRGVSNKTTLPVLMNTLITADNNELKLAATNLESALCLTIPAQIEEPGNTTIPAKLLYEFISSLPAGEVILESSDTKLTCVSRKFKAGIAGISANEFPPLIEFPNEPSLEIKSRDLILVIQQVTFAASSDEGRQILTGILLKLSQEGLISVATDGYRLSKVELKELGSKEEFQVIVPSRSMIEITRLFSDRKDEVLKLALSNNQLLVKSANILFSSRIIDGQFPNYQRIIPQGFETRAIVDHDELVKAVKISSVFAKDNANIIRLAIKPGESEPIYLSGGTAQVGDETGRVEASVSGESVEIAFNSRYLIEALNAIKSTQLSIELSGPLKPGLFQPVGDNTVVHIVMPVRIQGQ